MAVVTREMIEQLKRLKATQRWICFASGNTYRHKDEFKRMHFHWAPEDEEWVKEGILFGEKMMLEQMRTIGSLNGINFTWVEEK